MVWTAWLSLRMVVAGPNSVSSIGADAMRAMTAVPDGAPPAGTPTACAVRR
jgi:hypothetical protein